MKEWNLSLRKTSNKYAEGYPDKRYYGGCECVDIAEKLAIERAKKLFDVKFVNVQPHSGSQANMGVYKALLNIGDTILGMKLDHGGHLTHGKNVNFSGKDYNVCSYSVRKDDEHIDYEEVERLAMEVKPKLIVAGASAYSRTIDFKKFREIADKVGAILMVDMAHIAGLVAAGEHPSPIPYAHVVTTTTHKTLRGPRGGVIMTNDEEIAKKIDKAIFPGIQGGPLMHIIAAKAVAFKQALEPEFKEYQKQVVKNAKILAEVLNAGGLRVVSGGTDNHMVLIDVKANKNLTGAQVEKALGKAGITVNKNGIPYDTEKPMVTSGIRTGSPAMTTRGMKEEEMKQIANFILQVVDNIDDDKKIESHRSDWTTAKGLMSKYISSNKTIGSPKQIARTYIKASGGSSRLIGNIGKNATIKLGNVFESFVKNGISQTLNDIGISIKGSSLQEAMSKLVNYVQEEAVSKNDIAIRTATANTLEKLLELNLDDDKLDSDAAKLLMQYFFSDLIWQQMLVDFGYSFEKYGNNLDELVQVEASMQDYIKASVEEAFKQNKDNIFSKDMYDGIFEMCLEIMEA